MSQRDTQFGQGIKQAVAAGVRWSGLGWLLRRILARRGATILIYHDPEPDTFRRHLAWLARRYTIIPLSQLVRAIRQRDRTLLPPRSLVITLDDGHRGNAALLPVLQEASGQGCAQDRKEGRREGSKQGSKQGSRVGSPVTIYLCTQLVNTERHFWFAGRESESLKRLADAERIARLAGAGFSLTGEFPGQRQALNLDELRAMMEGGEEGSEEGSSEGSEGSSLVDFQSHGRFHRVLTTCDDATARDEIAGSKADLEGLAALLGRAGRGSRCEHFSYPNGDYGPRDVELVRQAGYLSARTVDPGVNTLATDPYRLRAMCVLDDASINFLALQVTGISPRIKRLLRRRKSPQITQVWVKNTGYPYDSTKPSSES